MGIKGTKAFQERAEASQYTREAHLEDYFSRTKEDEEKEYILRHCLTNDAMDKASIVKWKNLELYYTLRDVVYRSYLGGKAWHNSINIERYKYIMGRLIGMRSKERIKEWMNTYARKIL